MKTGENVIKIFVIILVFFGVSCGQSFQQINLPKNNEILFNQTTLHQKSMTGAIILETFIPTLGFLYAANWKKGVLPELTKFSGLFLAASQVRLNIFGNGSDIKNDFLFTSGLVITFAGLVWTYASLADAVNEYNDSIKIDLTQSVLNNSKTVKINLAFKF